MIVKREIIDKIANAAKGQKSEIGGILGSRQDGTVTEIAVDLPNERTLCRFEYYPDVAFLNSKIEEWASRDIDFIGIFHTHFGGSKSLSKGDEVYIKAIMECAKNISDCLLFPIFTLPDNEMTVYKACFLNDSIIIDKEELSIV